MDPEPGLKGFLVVDNVDKLCLLRLHYKDAVLIHKN